MIGQTVRDYTIIEQIGKGGMGVVYRAVDTRLDRQVALKFLSPRHIDDEHIRKRFEIEARSASSLDHPNICTVHQISETEAGDLFICMAYYEGVTLKEKIEAQQIDLCDAIRIARAVGSGLAAAHQKGIIHRDIKASNIMLTNDGFVKILDFGLAKMVDRTTITTQGTRLGTLDYMAPEQVRGQKVDHRVDIWAWGILLYNMVTCQLPFHTDHPLTLMERILIMDPSIPSSLNASISNDLDRVILKAIHKNRSKRFQMMEEAIGELEGVHEAHPSQTMTERSIPFGKQDDETRSLP